MTLCQKLQSLLYRVPSGILVPGTLVLVLYVILFDTVPYDGSAIQTQMGFGFDYIYYEKERRDTSLDRRKSIRTCNHSESLRNREQKISLGWMTNVLTLLRQGRPGFEGPANLAATQAPLVFDPQCRPHTLLWFVSPVGEVFCCC